MDMKLELVAVPVTDVDRAKDFYVQAGFVLDHDHTVSDEVRFVQLTPPGSALLDRGRQGPDRRWSRARSTTCRWWWPTPTRRSADLKARGIEVSDVDDQPWGRFVYFSDPDGNGWSLQQLPDWSRRARSSRRSGGRAASAHRWLRKAR